MAFSDWITSPNWQPVVLIEIEVGHRIDVDVWTQDAAPNDSCWWIDHSAEGEPARVEADGAELTERASLALCQTNPGSWFYDSVTGYLHVNLPESGGIDPGGGTYVILSYFWEYLTSKQFQAPDEIVFNGHWYLPYLDEASIPDIKLSVGHWNEGKSGQDFGPIRLINADGYFDSRLYDYIYEGKKLLCKIGARGAPYEDYQTYAAVKTGSTTWTDTEVEIESLDMRR